MKVFFSCGEASGDKYAGEILRRLNHLVKNLDVVALGGNALRNEGATLLADSSSWGAIGIFHSLLVVPKILPNYFVARRFLAKNKGIFVAVDFGYLNVKLVRYAKKCGWKVMYFIPPGSWKKQARQTELAQTCDAIISPFAWNAEQLKQQGANVFFFGHPLLDLVRTDESGERMGVALLPGSRMHELEYNFPVMAEAVKQINPDKIWIPIAQNLQAEDVKRTWQRLAPTLFERTNFDFDAGGALVRAKAAIVCSGSATLESALCECPHIIIYRGSTMMKIEFKILKPQFEHVGMSNILAGKRIFPELLQDDASVENIVSSLAPLLENTEQRATQLKAMASIRTAAMPQGCFDETARMLMAWINAKN